MLAGRIRFTGAGFLIFLTLALGTGLVLYARSVSISQTTWNAPASGGTLSIELTTTTSDEMWTASASMVTTLAGSSVGAASFADATGTAARFANPNHIVADAGGNVYVADWSNNRIRKVTPAGVVTVFAGSGAAGGVDGLGTAASFNGPRGIAIDAGGTLYVAESWGHRIRKISPAGVVTTVAGNGTAGYVDANGTSARFWYPSGVAIDGGGNLYVTEEHNSTVRKVTPAGDVTTLAGNGTAGYVDATGTAARFNVPFGVAIDGAGNIYVADSGNNRIRKVTPAGVVTTVAGSGGTGAADGDGATAQFNDPWGLAVDEIGNTYVADLGNHRVRRIALDGSVTTLAGSSEGYADGTAASAQFTQPVGVALVQGGAVLVVSERNGGNRIRRLTLPEHLAVTTLAGSTEGVASFADGTSTDAQFAYPNHVVADAAGNVYVADWGNNRIRKVTPTGVVSTFAGSGAAGGADGTGTSASFHGPRGIAIDAGGTLYVAESWGHRIRKITPAAVVTTVAGDGTAGYVDANGTSARFWYPSGVAIDGGGNLYVTEEHNATVRKITPAGDVTTLAGNGTAGYADATGTAAQFNEPYGVAADEAGNVYVADSMNHRIRKVTAAGAVTTVAGSGTAGFADGVGTAAQFSEPWGLTTDSAGALYVADLGNHRLRRVAPDGRVTTLAGSSGGYADGTAGSAQFTQPVGVTWSQGGTVLVVSERNGGNRIRRLTSGADWLTASPASGVGSGSVTLTAEPSSSPFPRSASVMVAGQPVVVTQDGAASAIGVSPTVLDFGAMLVGSGPMDRTLTVTNAGNVVLDGWEWTFGALGDPVGGTCGSAVNPDGRYSLTPGQSCTFVLRFTPLAAGATGGAITIGMRSSPGDPFDVTWDGSWTATVAPPAIVLDGLTQTYDGTPRIVTATPTPAGLIVTVTYTGTAGATYGPSTTPPTAAGTYGVSATTNLGGLEEATLTVEKASSVIAWAVPAPIAVGTPLSAAQLNATALDPPVGYLSVATAPIETTGPAVLTADAAGALYVGEYDGGRVLKVLPSGDVQVLATTSGVYGIAVDSAGTVYVSEIWNHRILKILPNGTVSTLAGSISRGSADGIGVAAQFYYPCGLALDGTGMLYVADRDNHRIRKIDPSTGVVTTVAGSTQGYADGTGAAAKFNTPWDVAFDAAGALYVADTGNLRIRKLSAAGAVTTVAGSTEGYADGTGAAAKFAAPWGIAVDAAGMVYVADGGNGNGDFFWIGDGNNRVRRVSPAGDVTTVAGSGAFGNADGLPAEATFNVPRDVAVGPDGTVFVADQHNSQVRVVTVGPLGSFAYDPPAGTVLPEGLHTLSVTFTPQDQANWLSAAASVELQVQAAPPQASISVTPAVVNFGTLIAGGASADEAITITNTGETTLSGWQWSFGGLGNPVGGTCGSAAANPGGFYSLTPGQSCTFLLRFTPASIGPHGGSLYVGMRSSATAPDTWDVTWNGSWTASVDVAPQPRARTDFDGDGKSDVLWRHATQGDIWLWAMDGNIRTTEAYVRTIADTDWQIRAIADFTGDGKADLLWRNQLTGEVYLWPMESAAPQDEAYVATVDTAYDIAGTGDCDGDGKADILWRHTTSGDVWVWPMDGATRLDQVYIDRVDPGYVVTGVGDLDGDGKADIVWHGAAGDVWVWPMDGTTRLDQVWVGTVPDTGYQIQAVADVGGDGKADLLWWHATRGEVWVWTMNGATREAETWVGTVPDTTYRVAATGDYDGDGKADILWHQTTRGEVWLWLMNGPTRLSETWIATVPDAGYTIVR